MTSPTSNLRDASPAGFEDVHDLLLDLDQRGVRLRLVDGRVDVLAPAGSLTPDLRRLLGHHRERLTRLLVGLAPADEPAAVASRPDERYEPFPLTDIQHAYWVGRNPALPLGGVCTHYYFELDGSGLEPTRLTDSLHRVVLRHDMLRAVVEPDGRQRVLADVAPYEIAVNDLRGLSPSARGARLARIRRAMGDRVPPPDRWPLFEVAVSLLDDGRTRLHVGINLLVADAYSLTLIFEDWRRFYQNPDWSPPPPSVTYRDYVLSTEAARGSHRYQSAERYWSQRLESLPSAPPLPLAKQPGQLVRAAFTGRRARLARRRWDTVKRLARHHGLTPSTVLMAAFCDVLRAWSRQDAFTLNVTLFDRPQVHPDIAVIVGDFTTLTMLAVSNPAGEVFTQRAARLQRQLMQDLAHTAYSGVRVLRERARRRGSVPDAAMPVVFTSAIGVAGDGEESGRRFFGDLVYSISQTPQVWLDHQVTQERGALTYNWDAIEELFPRGVLDDMFAAYRTLLDRLSRDEAAWTTTEPLIGLPSWQAHEREQANDTTVELPPATLGGLVEAQATVRPDAVAVIAPEVTLSYRALVHDARKLARRLRALGEGPGSLVAVVMDKSVEHVPAVLGVVLSGAAYLPVDPRWPSDRLARVLELGRVRTVVTSGPERDRIGWPAGISVVTLADAAVQAEDSAPLPPQATPEDLAYVIFTSGSTGDPKGVMIDHRGAVNTVLDLNRRFRVGSHDRVLSLSALTFDLSVYDIFGLLAAGGAIVLPHAESTRDSGAWSDLVGRNGVTIWNTVPALMQAWLQARRGPAIAQSRLRLVLLSGDWIPVSLPAEIRAVHPDAEVVSLGGATEASIWSVAFPIGDVPADWTRIPYGRPLANQTLHVYDERLQPCPVWTVGEIYIGGTGLAKGYWADPERSAERFVSHPRTKERLYRTGDLGRYLPGGDIEFLGRKDLQVKLNGYRIELGEIAAVLGRLPGVGEALVDVATHPATGRRQLVAYVVADNGASAGATDDRRWSSAVDAGLAEVEPSRTELAGELAAFERWWRSVEALCPLVIARTLAHLGALAAPHHPTTAAELVAGSRLRYAGLVEQWLSVLVRHGFLRRGSGSEYLCERPVDIGDLDAAIRTGFAALDVEGPDRVFVDYLHSCADRQIELLRGEVNPLELLLPGGGWQVLDTLYAANPVSRLLNRTVARLVAAYVDRSPGAVGILELGAGTGATSARVLAALRTTAPGRIDYHFTDISSYFTDRARHRFAEFGFVRYGTMDIDRPLGEQAVPPGSVDVVIAANVLHNARDLPRTLAGVRAAMRPGGILLALEGTENSLIQMISVGFLEGFAHHEGQRSLPLLTVPEWRSSLAAAGMTRFTTVPPREAVAAAMVQHVLVSAAPEGPDLIDPIHLRDALARRLPDYLVPQHYLVLDALPLSANGKVDRASLPAPWPVASEPAPARPERVGPADDVEGALLDIWRDVLQRDNLSVDDNFFELGGDSLHAVRILGRARDELGLALTVDDGLQALFDGPTIAELAVTMRSVGGRS